MLAIDTSLCTGCGGCQELCPATAICLTDGLMHINADKCTGCKICLKVCPVKAVTET